jgi:TDG/mug DNA glycosylase family protein
MTRKPGPKTSGAIKYSFPPIVPEDAHLLILGTLPGEESLRLRQYYGHPRNHFWQLIAALSDKPLPETYEERIALLHANGWALWDVLEGAERTGSSDTAIRNPIVNAFGDFFAHHPAIKTVAFNGQKARDLFRRYVLRANVIDETRLVAIDLPSSSPLYTKSLEEKLALWRPTLEPFVLRNQNRREK